MMCGSMELSAAISHCVARARAPVLGQQRFAAFPDVEHDRSGFERDVTLKMKRFPLLFSACSPVTPKSAPVIFYEGISLETLMESAFVDDIVVILAPILRFSPVFCPVIPENSQWDEFGSDCILSQLPGMFGLAKI
jgi:hypothetical protein